MSGAESSSGQRIQPRRAAIWFGAFVGPSAWTVQLIGDWFLGEVIACAPATMPSGSILGLHVNVFTGIVSGVLLALTVLSGVLSYAEHRRLRAQGVWPADPWIWLAVAGVMSSGLFSILIATSFVPIALIGGCR
jgi:hypothetical protein